MTTTEIPYISFRALEQRVQEFRLQTLALAGEQATHEGRHEVYISDLVAALDKAVANQIHPSVSISASPKIAASAQDFLDGQTHRLRVLVASIAQMKNKVPTPADIEAAWAEIRTSPTRLKRALTYSSQSLVGSA